MDLKATKIELVKLILSIENVELIERVKDFLNTETEDFWNVLSESEKEEIKIGLDQLNRGQKVSLESVLKEI